MTLIPAYEREPFLPSLETEVTRAGEELYALPLPTVEGVVRVPRSEVLRHLAEEAAGFVLRLRGCRPYSQIVEKDPVAGRRPH